MATLLMKWVTIISVDLLDMLRELWKKHTLAVLSRALKMDLFIQDVLLVM